MSFSGTSHFKQEFGIRDQAARIPLICPGFNYKLRDGQLVGTGSIQPAPLCDSYVFRLTYKCGEFPKVTIVNPPLRCRADQERIPHTYSPTEPCLFRPGTDWDSSQCIATTIIPWLAMWLSFYELWHATGEWLGGGEHPEMPEDSASKEATSEIPIEEE